MSVTKAQIKMVLLDSDSKPDTSYLERNQEWVNKREKYKNSSLDLRAKWSVDQFKCFWYSWTGEKSEVIPPELLEQARTRAIEYFKENHQSCVVNPEVWKEMMKDIGVARSEGKDRLPLRESMLRLLVSAYETDYEEVQRDKKFIKGLNKGQDNSSNVKSNMFDETTEETPVETPAEETPVEETPAEETPAEETKEEEAPAEETPGEEAKEEEETKEGE